MKRPRNLDPPPVSRRKRALSREEVELWESVAKQAKPLRKRPRSLKVSAEALEESPVAPKLAPAPKSPAMHRKIPAEIGRAHV